LAESGSKSRLIAIGDIHGHSKTLSQVLRKIAPSLEDTIVCLGDCVNRGPDTQGVLDQLIDLERKCRLVCILGNHEEVMLDCRHDSRSIDRWMYQGGMDTLMSYGTRGSIGDVPKEHWEFLDRFVPFFETEEYIFVHANYEWYLPMDQQPESLLRWTSIDDSPPRPHISGKRVILGHQPGPIRNVGHYICIDTGCGFGGQLTAIVLCCGQNPLVIACNDKGLVK
jgi:serine/threonine protein phosphatase 1